MTDTVEPVVTPVRPKRSRAKYIVVAVLCVGAIGWMLVLMQKNVVFFKTVSQAVHDEPHDGTHSLRIGGGVVPKSIVQRGDGVDFKLTEGGVTVLVHHTGGEPPLFKDCAPVVAEGHWQGERSATFDSTRLLIKHGSDYRAPSTSASGDCPNDPVNR